MGKNNTVVDCLSRGATNAVHLDVDYAQMATDQLSDPEVQAYRTAVTNLQLAEVQFDSAGASLLCDISTGRPRPIVPDGWRWRIFDVIHGVHPCRKPTQRLLNLCGVG